MKKNWTLDDIAGLSVEQTGDAWFDARYLEDVQPYYRLFYRIAQTLRPRFSVELGAYRATAAAALALGNPDGQVVTIDIHKDGDHMAVLKSIEAAQHCPNLQYVNKWTWDAVPDVQAYGMPIELLFVDAWHVTEYIDKDWAIYRPLLADDALIIIDDVFYGPPCIDGTVEFYQSFVDAGYACFVSGNYHACVPMGFIKWTGSK